MNIFCLSDEKNPAHPFAEHHDTVSVSFFNNVNVLLEKLTETCDAIILSSNIFLKNTITLKAIRKNVKGYIIPIFTHTLVPLTTLCDGSCDDQNAVLLTINTIQEKLKVLQQKPHDSETAFLAYCYSRAPLTLAPKTSWHSPTFYYYPLVELWISDKRIIPQWLQTCAERNLLEETGEISHNIVCGYCFSAHIQFVERCPQCHSTQLKPTSFLHCFSCGFIAPEHDFIQTGRLSCPKCHTQLRLIGEDYDRPLETGECQNCHVHYQEPQSWCQCMICRKSYSPEELYTQHYSTYQVSTLNAEYILHRHFEAHWVIFDELQCIEPNFFMAVLEWLFKIQTRYPEEKFAVIGISFDFIYISPTKFHHFIKELKTLLRQTDWVSKLMDNELWLILPKTDEPGLNMVVQRLKNHLSNLISESGYKLTAQSNEYFSNELSMEQQLIALRTRDLCF